MSAWEDDEPDMLCERCGEGFDMTEANVEAFEITGLALCPDCADELFEERTR